MALLRNIDPIAKCTYYSLFLTWWCVFGVFLQNATAKAGKKCETSLEYGQRLHQNGEFCTHFQEILEEKDPNIHLNDKFSLKIANISLQKQNFPEMRCPNLSMHDSLTFSGAPTNK